MSAGPLPPISYQAKWPKHLDPALKSLASKVAHFFWNLISIIIFPIGLVRLLQGTLKDKALGLAVPGAFDILDCDPLSHYLGHRLNLSAPDGTKLDGAFFPGKMRNKAIIYAFGNGEQWETCSHILEQLKPLNTSILMINPRRVGKSEGTRSEEGYALDIYAAYDFLIKKQNIDPSDIEFVGFSMGAAYGTCGAALVQEEYPDKEINAINIKSFSDLQLEVQTILKRGGLLVQIARIANKVLRFHLTPKEAWDKLKGKKCIFYDPSDEIISESCSLFKAVQDHPVGTTEVIKMAPRGHNADFTNDELTVLQDMILKHLKINRSETELGWLYLSNFLGPRDLKPRVYAD